LETLQVTFVEVDSMTQRTVDPLTFFQDPSLLIVVKTSLEEQTQKKARLHQWMEELKAPIHPCQEQERLSKESDVV
jgi:hypothetical protein